MQVRGDDDKGMVKGKGQGKGINVFWFTYHIVYRVSTYLDLQVLNQVAKSMNSFFKLCCLPDHTSIGMSPFNADVGCLFLNQF